MTTTKPARARRAVATVCLTVLAGLTMAPTASSQDDILDPAWCIVDDSGEQPEGCDAEGDGAGSCKQKSYSGRGRVDFENGYDSNHNHFGQGTWVNGCGGTKAEGNHFDDRVLGTFTHDGIEIGSFDIDEISPSNAPCDYSFRGGVQGSFDRGFVAPKKDWVEFMCRTEGNDLLTTVYTGDLTLRGAAETTISELVAETTHTH